MIPEFTPHPLIEDYVRYETRRQFFKRGASLLGTAALASLAPGMLLPVKRNRMPPQTRKKCCVPSVRNFRPRRSA
ncbi:MAG: hypothetical protein WDM76_13055 [Limisphaerales bacterium]